MKNTLMKWLSAPTLLALVLGTVSPVEAGYGSSGGSSGYTPGYGSSGGYGSTGYGSTGGYGSGGGHGSSGGSVGGGYGSSGGQVGPLRRIGARLHDRVHSHVARRASYGSSGGAYVAGGSSGGAYRSYSVGGSSGGGSSGGHATYSYGSTGSYSGGSTGTYSGGSTGSYGSVYRGSTGGGSSGAVIEHGYGGYESYPSEVPMMNGEYSPGTIEMPTYNLGTGVPAASATQRTANKLASNQSIQPNEVHLTVNLPDAAKVFVNGNPTATMGGTRHFVSRDLKPNESYRFEVKAVLAQPDGSEVVQNKTVVLESGNGEELNFDMSKADDPIETVLTLHVPEKARVVLAQNSTKSEGTSRIFRTKQLSEGQSWDDYKIEVTYEGVTKERTIRLIGGDKLEFSFNFDETDTTNKVALR